MIPEPVLLGIIGPCSQLLLPDNALATSIATLVTAVGSVYYFHSKVMWAMVLGFLLIIYCAFMWFRDVVIEAEHKGHH